MMNWSKGFFRLWLVLSIIWAVSLFAISRPDQEVRNYFAAKSELRGGDGKIYRDEFLNAAEKAAAANDIAAAERLQKLADDLGDDPAAYYKMEGLKKLERALSSFKQDMLLIFAPIIIVFSIGAGLLWAVRGFRGDNRT